MLVTVAINSRNDGITKKTTKVGVAATKNQPICVRPDHCQVAAGNEPKTWMARKGCEYASAAVSR